MDESTDSLTLLLAQHQMCLPCLASKLGTTAQEVEAALAGIERGLHVARRARTCPFCGVRGPVLSLDVPIPSGDRR